MKGKMNKKSIIALIIVGVLALCALGGWLIWKNHHQPVVDETIQEETDMDTAPVLVLDYNNVSLGLDHSFTVQAKTYFKGEEVKDKIEYTWELDEESSADIASMEPKNDSATITGLAYGETAFKVSAEYKGTILVKTMKVHVSNIDVIFDSPNMELSAGCYTVNLWLLETETNITSLTPEIYVYDKEELVENPVFTWTNSDESIAVRDENGTITAKKAGSTLIVGTYKESELHIRVNVYRTKLEKDPVCIEQVKNYALSLSELRGMEVEDARFNGESVLKDYTKSSGTLKFDPDKLPELGVTGELIIQTDKAEFVMKATVVTMALHNEADLNRLASVIAANKGEGYYALANDIRCTGFYDSNLTVEFKGTFDGLGNTIYNMTTSDRDASNRGLLGASMSDTGVVQNVSFVNAKHGGKGAFIVTSSSGTMKNVYIQIDITEPNSGEWDNATSVLASSTTGVFSTQNVLIEYINPLPSDAPNGYAVWRFNYGYAKHQGLYVVGADSVCNNSYELPGRLKDVYGAYLTYGDFLDAGVDVTTWENDFWAVTNGIPYPTNLGTRTGSKPNVSIPEYISAGTQVRINGATIYDRVILSSATKRLGVTVSGNILSIPKTVSTGSKITLTVQSVFDASKKTTISATVLDTDYITLQGTYYAETYNQTTFSVDFGSVASKVEGADLFYVAVDGKPFARKLYANGILTLDTDSMESFGEKTVEATFKKGNKLIVVTIPIDVCTMAIHDETDLNNMAAVILENKGAGRYVLAKDIVCTGTYDSKLSVSFTGTFDGRGYAIYNMTTSGRDGGNRGLLGASMSDTGVVQNVSFVNAKHGGKGAFIATSSSGTMKNVYIQIDITEPNSGEWDNATSILASSTTGVFTTQNVLIEYINPLPSGAPNGYAVWRFNYGYAKHQGLYVVGADSVCNNSYEMAGGLKDVYGAYAGFGDFVDAGISFSAWDNEFWAIYNGLPYPENLEPRVGTVPAVSIPKYVGAGASVVIDGLTMYDRVVLSSDMKALGITVEDGKVLIPKSVPKGTNLRVTVQSVFDSSKRTTLQATVYETINVTLEETYDVATHDKTTFDIDFGTQASVVDGGTLISATVGNSNFAKATYQEGVLTLDTSTLASYGEQVVTAVFDKDNRLVTVTINIDVSTMVINTEEDLNNMASIITANNGAGRYVLGQDVVCQGTYDSNLGVSFTGTFDGRGYAIYNMTTSDRDGGNRGLLGASMSDTGVVQNVSFVNAKHGGKGAFIATSSSGTMKNVYIQIDITAPNSGEWDNATSILASSTTGVFTTQNVLIEYINPLPSGAPNGYAVWRLNYGYAKHQGLYAVGADRVCNNSYEMAGGLQDIYGAFVNYGDFITAKNDLSKWNNDFWTVTNGIPYPTKLGIREAVMPEVSIPTVVAPGSNVVIEGASMYDRVILDADAKELGITVSNNVLNIPNTVPSGTEITLVVQSVFDETKQMSLKTDVLTSKNVELDSVTTVEVYDNSYFQVDLTSLAAEVGEATLVSASVDGKAFASTSYENSILTLDTVTLGGLGAKNVSVSLKGTDSLVSVVIPIDVCTMAIANEEDLNNMASVIALNSGTGRYILTADIICEGTYDSNLGTQFVGTFDGCGHTIYNMTTSDRDGGNRGLLGASMGGDGIVQNVSFVNAKHSGKGAFIATSNAGTIKNVYIQIDITAPNSGEWDNATSILASSTTGVFTTQNVLIEYINPLPSGAPNGYAVWRLNYGYAKHQGLYAVGADRVCNNSYEMAGGLQDIYGAFVTYDDFVAAQNDMTNWANDFWTVTDGIPYPTKLGTREAAVPEVSIPEIVEPGSDVVIEGARVYERIILDAEAQALGITVTGNVVSIPDAVALGTEVHLTVVSIFDTSKSTALTTTVNMQQDDEGLTPITWKDFGFTLGTTYTGAKDESSAPSNAGSYTSATNLNNTEFVGDVVFGDNSEIRYGGSAYNYGLKIKVEDGAFKVGGSNLYLYSTTNGSQISEIVIPKADAGNYGLTSFANEQFTLKIKITEWNGNTGWSTMYAGIWINDVAVIESVKLGSGAFGNMFCTCVYGSVTPSVKLTEITWTDFGFTLGTTYTGATDESSAASNAGSYASATNLNNTEFVGDVVFGDNSEIRYGGSAYNYGLKIKVEDGAFKVGGSNLYLYDAVLGSQISEIVIPKTDAGNYGLTSFADEQFTLKIKIKGWNGNSGWSSMMAGIWINDVAVIESVKLGSGAFGNMFCTCVYGSVTLAAPKVELTKIGWEDFDGAEYGKTYSTQQLLTYKGDSLNNTAFEDDIIFPAGSTLLYGVNNAWHGLEIGVNESGQFWVHGSNYFNGSSTFDVTYDASHFGLAKLADTKITLRIEMENVTETYAEVNVYVNGIQAGSTIALTKSTISAVAGIGKKIAVCPFNSGDRQPFSIPEKRS